MPRQLFHDEPPQKLVARHTFPLAVFDKPGEVLNIKLCSDGAKVRSVPRSPLQESVCFAHIAAPLAQSASPAMKAAFVGLPFSGETTAPK